MRPIFRFLLFSLALSAPVMPAARAQNKPKAPVLPAPASAAALPAAPVVTTGLRGEQFVLGPDDVIAVTVANHPEMSADALPISPSGRVALPVVGPLTVSGKTLAQAQNAILAAYKTQLRAPKVSVTLTRARPRQATVLGAVARPGAIDLQPGWRVSEVLAAAGGLAEIVPEDARATLKHLNGAPLQLDLATIYRAPENAANPRVVVGDVLSIVALPLVNVTLNGDLGKPGPQSSRTAPRLLDAIGRAGDLKFSPADTEVSLLRAGKITSLDVEAATDAPTGPANITLQDNDLLSFQAVRLNVNVFSDENLVKLPGNVQLEGHSTFMRAFSAAGGPTVPIDQIQASVRRGNQIIPVDISRAVYDPSADIALQNNDTIYLRPIDGLRVQVTGTVKSPGSYRLKEGTKVMEAVLKQGDGLSVAPDQTAITILRTLPDDRQIYLNVDAERLWRGQDLSQNVTLKDRDVVLVNPVASRSVIVAGEVTTPGAYELQTGDGLAEVMARAGGPTQLAQLSRVSILHRDGQMEKVNLTGLETGQVPNIKLRNGDSISIGKNPNQVLVMNAVNKPGYIAIPEGGKLTLGDAIIRAGGTERGAKTSEIALLRQVPVSAENPEGVSARRVPFNELKQGNLANTILLNLQPGDVIYVPEGKVSQTGLQKATQALSLFGTATVLGGRF